MTDLCKICGKLVPKACTPKTDECPYKLEPEVTFWEEPLERGIASDPRRWIKAPPRAEKDEEEID